MTRCVFALTPGCCAVYLLNRRVNDSSFIGVHGLEACFFACFDSLESELSAEDLKGFFTLVAVISDIYGNLYIFLGVVVSYKACKILQSVECFAASADYEALFLARKIKGEGVFLFVCTALDRDIGKPHVVENVS